MAKKYNNVRERNGKFYYRYDTKDPLTGKRKQLETTGFSTAKEAEKEGLRIRAEMLNGTYVKEKEIMLSDWVDQWLEIYRASGKVKERTIGARKNSLNALTREFGGLKLREITPLKYQKFLNDLKIRSTGKGGKKKAEEGEEEKEREGNSQSTIKLVNSAADMMFSKAVQLGLIKVNPAKESVMPAFQKTVEELESEQDIPKFLEKEQLALLLTTAKESENVQGYHGLLFLAYTGLRIGEMCALKTSDIDYENRTISITKTLNDQNGGISAFKIGTPKTLSSKRKVDVSMTVIKILESQSTWRNQYKMSRRREWYNESDFIFVNTGHFPGYPSKLRTFRKFLTTMLKESKTLPTNLTPHSLRHTYTSLMAEAGVELSAIQRLLGHSNNAITERVYLHVTKARKKEAVEKLDALMDGLY